VCVCLSLSLSLSLLFYNKKTQIYKKNFRFKGFWARPQANPDGTKNFMEWECGKPRTLKTTSQKMA